MTAQPLRTVDLNADLGESFGAWTLGDDAGLLDVVTSANVACGFHAGDPSTMLATCRAAAGRGVAIGAHVSYRDLAGFGRRPMTVPPAELHAEIVYQLAALLGVARVAGARVSYVKPHGALYNRIVTDPVQARAVAEAVRDVDPELPILGLAHSRIEEAAAAAGLPFRREAFVDRGYADDGTLVPRGEPGALLHDVDAIARRAVGLARDGRVTTVSGAGIAVEVDSLCVHGDTPGAVAMAVAVRSALEEAGIAVRAAAEPARGSRG